MSKTKLTSAAEVEYNDKLDTIQVAIKELQERLELHKKLANEKGINYGHCGDLGYVIGNLDEILNFMPQPEVKRRSK